MSKNDNYEIVKTDRRHSAYQHFTHYIQMRYNLYSGQNGKTKKFVEYRNYCWATWGPSCERDLYLNLGKEDLQPTSGWCWHVIDSIQRIYFVDEKHLTWFNLKWL